MDDLISRQAAIEAVMECYDNDELFEVYEEKLRELPPSQPEQLGANLAEVGTDCISRQAAIVALGTITVYKGSIPFDTAMMRIEQLPPAQPKRIRGRWTRDNACSECGCQPWFSGDIHNYNFCPNCGADMREVTE